MKEAWTWNIDDLIGIEFSFKKQKRAFSINIFL